jgi:hypothetical protein
MQHYGTDKVGWLFAPIVLLWFILIGSVGAINIHKYDNSVLKAYNPIYIYRFFQRRRNSDVWTSLGGIMLSITGQSWITLPFFEWGVGVKKYRLLCFISKVFFSSVQELKRYLLISVTFLCWQFR